MKGTEEFKKVIADYLKKRAEEDALFSETYKKPNKSLEECVNYILSQVRASGCNGFADAEIFSMAVHYYDEDKLKNGKRFSGSVVVNRVIELSDEEKEAAKQKALESAIAEEKQRLTAKRVKKADTQKVEQTSLFDNYGT